jgi:hypothetical protein
MVTMTQKRGTSRIGRPLVVLMQVAVLLIMVQPTRASVPRRLINDREESSSPPTLAPSSTPAPSTSPSEAPTEVPSEVPTEVPSEVPSESPSESPTESPSSAPSTSPTKAPTVLLTEVPDMFPSVSPSDEPTETPSVNPSEDEDEDTNAIAVAFAAVTAAFFLCCCAAGTTTGSAAATNTCGGTSLWLTFGKAASAFFTFIYLLYQTSRLGGNTCYVFINDSPKQVELIVQENELTVADSQQTEFAFDPGEIIKLLSWFKVSRTYTKGVSRVTAATQKIPLPKGKTRKLLVPGDCYLTLRSYTKCFDPDSFESDRGHAYRGMRGYIVHLDNYRLVERETKLDDLAQGIISFLPDQPKEQDETFTGNDSHEEAEINVEAPMAVSQLVVTPEVHSERRISSNEMFYDPELTSSSEFFRDPAGSSYSLNL